MEKQTKVMLITLSIIVALIVVVLILAVIQVPYVVSEKYTEQEPYLDTEIYYETEPYTTQECDGVKLKYVSEWDSDSQTCVNQICDRTESYCVDTNFWGNCIEYRDRCINYACTKYKKVCTVKIENIDDTYGTWTISGYKYDYNTKTEIFVKDLKVSVKAKRTSTASYDYLFDAGENIGCYYLVKEIPEKTECRDVIKQRDVKKSRQITKYRDVEKQRDLTKYCSAMKKIFEGCH